MVVSPPESWIQQGLGPDTESIHLSPIPTVVLLHPQDLIADLKYELTGKFERLIVNLMRPLAYCDAKEIKDAISVRSMGPSVLWGCRQG